MNQPNTPYTPPSSFQNSPKNNKGGDATGGVIPYKNPKALLSYYLGVFSIIPLLGFFTGIIAIVLGVLGLIDRSKNPVIKGSAHAIIGISCGVVAILVWGLVGASTIFFLLRGPGY